jgi:DHA3 family macrolide efflux protein-like MFS transporter
VTPLRRLCTAQTVSLLGDYLAVFAVQAAVVFRMHGSARDMGGVFVASLIPGIILGPVAGAFADRWNPRLSMIAADLARGALILLLMRAATLPQIYAISFAVSCCSSFFAPAQTISIPLLVPRADLLAANARMQQSMQLVRAAGPALAAAVVAGCGERLCYAADSASFFVSAAMLASLRYTRPASAAAPVHLFEDLRAGAAFLFTDSRCAFAALALTMGTFAAGCFSALAPLYVRDVLHRGPSTLGLIGSLIAACTMAGAGVLTLKRLKRFTCDCDPRRLIGAGMAGAGASILFIAAVPNAIAALAGAAAMGLSAAVVLLAASVTLQGGTPAQLRGRVSGAVASLTSMAQMAALLFAGTWASQLGIRGVFALSAALLFVTGIAQCSRSIRFTIGQSCPIMIRGPIEWRKNNRT